MHDDSMLSVRRAEGEASGKSYDVFISHAGPQKANFAGWLQRELRRHGISAFLDETSLRYGDAAGAEMEATLRSCSIVAVVLTTDFVRSTYCLQELHWALQSSQLHPAQPLPSEPAAVRSAAGSAPQPAPDMQQQAGGQGSRKPCMLLPVFYGISDISTLQQEVQRLMGEARDSGAPLHELQQAGADLASVCGITGVRQDSHSK